MVESPAASDPNALRRLLLEFLDASVGAGWRAATSDGQGAYLAAMLLFGLAAFFFHYALIPQTARERRLEMNAKDRQESLRGESYPVIAGLVLPPSYPALCDSAEAQDLRTQLRHGYEAFAQHANTRYHAVPDAPSVCDAIRKSSSSSAGSAIQLQQLPLRPACEATTPKSGPAWTDNALQSMLFIPSMTASPANAMCRALCAEGGSLPDCVCNATDALLKNHAEVIAASLALEDIAGQLLGSQDSKRPMISGAYFISPDGITRSIPSDGDKAIRVPAHYMNNGVSYFFDAILYGNESDACRKPRPDREGDARAAMIGNTDPLPGYVTYPYLDSYGNGLVETYCAPVDISSVAGEPPDRLLGVLCVDVRHPESEIVGDLIEATSALDLSLVRIVEPLRAVSSRLDQEGHEPHIMLCSQLECAKELTRLDETPVELRNFAAIYYRQQLAPSVHALRTGGVYSQDGLFAVSVYHGAHYWDVAVGHLRQASRQDHAALVLCGLCLALAIGILVVFYRRKAIRREAYLVRGLTFGIVQVNSSDVIVGANDRAEAILGQRLPSLGTESEHDPVRGARGGRRPSSFSSYLDKPRCVLIPLNNAPDEECIVPYNYVRWRSIEGLTTNFYVWLRDGGWIRATARVVIMPDGTENLFYVLSTHVCTEHAAILERAKQLHTPRVSGMAATLRGATS